MATTKTTLRLIAAGFAIGSVVLVALLALLDLGGTDNADLADGAALAAGVFGFVGLVIALLWWSRISERPRTPAELQIGFLVRMAVAELGLLLGILAVFMTGAVGPAMIGLGLFLLALLLLVLALARSQDSLPAD